MEDTNFKLVYEFEIFEDQNNSVDIPYVLHTSVHTIKKYIK